MKYNYNKLKQNGSYNELVEKLGDVELNIEKALKEIKNKIDKRNLESWADLGDLNRVLDDLKNINEYLT